MQYQNFVQEVQKLTFIANPDQADTAIKSVLGHLASRLEEPQAQKMTQNLPEPLNLQKLRSHQVDVTDISADQFLGDLCDQMQLNREQANQLVHTVFHIAKDAIGSDTVNEIQTNLPDDWARMIQAA